MKEKRLSNAFARARSKPALQERPNPVKEEFVINKRNVGYAQPSTKSPTSEQIEVLSLGEPARGLQITHSMTTGSVSTLEPAMITMSRDAY